VRSEQGDVTSNPVRIHEGGSRKDEPSVCNPWNLVAAPGENSFIWTTPAKPGDYFRVIAQCIIIWGQPSDGHRVRLPLRRGELNPLRGGGGEDRMRAWEGGGDG